MTAASAPVDAVASNDIAPSTVAIDFAVVRLGHDAVANIATIVIVER